MREMLEAYEELELREAHYPVGFNNTEKDLERNSGKKYGHQGSAAALLASEKKNYAFCLKNHAHEKCDGVVDRKTRKNIARKYGRCFLCLFKAIEPVIVVLRLSIRIVMAHTILHCVRLV